MRFKAVLKAAGILALAAFCCTLTIMSVPACNKATNPPIYDTVTVIKNDTTVKTDTLYATKPDPTVNLTKGLLLYLPFSGSFADSSGNNNPVAALNGASLSYDTHGWANNAFGANGTNQVLLVTNNGSIQFDTAWSVSLDFMAVDLTRRHDLISMVGWSNVTGPSFEIGWPDSTLHGQLQIGATDIAQGCGVNSPSNIPNLIGDTTGFVPQLGAWYNVIIIYHRASIQMYVNGNLYSSKTGTGTLANFCPASNVVIGGWWANDPVNLDGKLDNVRMYNRVLTPHEIALLASNYQVTSTAIRPGLQTH